MSKKIISILVVIILMSGFLFYWYEYRPTAIRKNCNKLAIQEAQHRYNPEGRYYFPEDYEHYYKECLRSKGIEK